MAAAAPSRRDPLIACSGRATGLEVRRMVEALGRALVDAGIPRDLRGSVTIAVAEALNNISEHAYAGRDPGPVHMTADHAPGGGIRVTLRDEGAPIPAGTPPAPRLPDSDGTRDALPEGGFGWYLIHKLSDDHAYNHEGVQNTLRLSFTRKRKPKQG